MPRSPLPRWPLPWLALVVAWWTVTGCAWGLQYYTLRRTVGSPVGFAEAMAPNLIGAYLWVPFTGFVVWAVRRWPLGATPWPRALAAHGGATVATVVGRAAVAAAVNQAFGWSAAPFTLRGIVAPSLLSNAVLHWMITGAAHGVQYFRLLRARDAQLAEARLAALAAQLQPHFLFNALNTVSALMHENVAAADRVLAGLSGLLRSSLESTGRHEVALREELDVIARYVDVEQARFEGRLTVQWAVAADALDARIPPWLLQPLVENGIRHGIAARAAPGYLRIAARREGGDLRVSISDHGPAPAPPGAARADATGRQGVGLSNVRARLEQLYRGRHQLTLTQRSSGGTVVTLTIPYRTAADVPRAA